MAGLVAVNYGEALFSLAKDENKFDEFRDELAVMNEVFYENKQLLKVLKHPSVEKNDKKEMIDKIFSDMSPYVKNFVKILIDKNRFAHFNDICKVYEKLYNEYHNIEVAYIQSATQLDDKQLLNIKNMLEKKLNKIVKLKVKVNSGLLAGIRIKIKDEILDNTALNRLEKMKEQVVKTTLL